MYFCLDFFFVSFFLFGFWLLNFILVSFEEIGIADLRAGNPWTFDRCLHIYRRDKMPCWLFYRVYWLPRNCTYDELKTTHNRLAFVASFDARPRSDQIIFSAGRLFFLLSGFFFICVQHSLLFNFQRTNKILCSEETTFSRFLYTKTKNERMTTKLFDFTK